MKQNVICVLACLMVASGCKKPADAPPPERKVEEKSAPAAPPAPGGNASAATPNSKAQSEADLAAALGELTQVLRKYSAEKRQVPKTLDELVAAGYLTKLPEAPAGKKFVINQKNVEVSLVNR